MDHRQDTFCKREITTSRSKIAKKKLSPKKRSALWIDTDQTLDNYQHEKYVAILHRHEFDKISPESQKFQDEQIDSVYTDGAYDTKQCRQVIADRQAHAVIPPRKNARP